MEMLVDKDDDAGEDRMEDDRNDNLVVNGTFDKSQGQWPSIKISARLNWGLTATQRTVVASFGWCSRMAWSACANDGAS